MLATQVFAKLINARPRHILLIYAAVILGFAFFFTALPDDFYETNIKYEPATRNNKTALATAVQTTIETEFKRDPKLGPGVNYQFMTGVQIPGAQDNAVAGTAQVYATLQGASNPLFALNVPLLVSPLTNKIQVLKPGYVGSPGDPKLPGFDGEIRPIYLTVDPQRSVQDQSTLPHSADELKTVATALSAAIERVKLSKSDIERAIAVVRAEQGRRSSRIGQFGGMLYFSAITITTVGYGDVVPLSALARFLAASEATFGIVLLGLFVNSIYKHNGF